MPRALKSYAEAIGATDSPEAEDQGRPPTPRIRSYAEAAGGADQRPPLDPRDIAASAQAEQPYLGAIGAQNVAQPRIPGAAGISGGALSDGMAEVVGFMRALEEDEALREQRPPGAGVMWGYGGQRSLAPTIANARALGIAQPEATIQPIRPRELTLGSAAEYLAGVPSRMGRQARGYVRAVAGELAGAEGLRRKGEAELSRVATEREATQPDTSENALARWTVGAIESIATMATGALVGAAFGAPLAGSLAGFGLTTGGETYERLGREGVSGGKRLAASLASGGLEAATELLPAGAILNRFGKEGTKRFIAELFVKEIGGEHANALGQAFVDEIVKNPNRPILDAAKSAVMEMARQSPDIIGTVGMQSLLMGGASAAARRAATRQQMGIKMPAQEQKTSAEAERAIAEMQRQAAEKEKPPAELYDKNRPVSPNEKWETAKRAFEREESAGGQVYWVAPSGARITEGDWDAASERIRQMWLRPAEKELSPPKPPEPRKLSAKEILETRPEEYIVAKPAKPTSDRLEKLRRDLEAAVSPDVKRELSREIAKEERALEVRYAAEEFAQMAEEETDPARKALLWNAAAKLVVPKETQAERPPRGGISVQELTVPEPEPPPQVPVKGIVVQEATPESFVEAQMAGDAGPEDIAVEEANEAARAERERQMVEPSVSPRQDEAGRIATAIRETRQRIEGLNKEKERIDDPRAAKVVDQQIKKERAKLDKLIEANGLLRGLGRTTDQEVASKMREKLDGILEKFAPPKTQKSKVAPVTEQDQLKPAQSPLLRAIWNKSLSYKTPGIDKKLMSDIGVEERLGRHESHYFTKSGKLVKRTLPVMRRYYMGFGSENALFQDNGLQEDGIISALSEAGYLPPEDVMAASPHVRWQDIAMDMVRQELLNPGSVMPIGMQELPAQRAMRSDWENYIYDEANALDIEIGARRFEEIEADVLRALASDWTASMDEQEREAYEYWAEQNKLKEHEAYLAALTRQASEIDEDAVHDAAVRYANDDNAFLNAVRRIINEGKRAEAAKGQQAEQPRTEQALQGRADDAGAGVPQLAGEGGGARNLAADIEERGAEEAGPAGGEPGAGSGVAGEGTRLSLARSIAGQQSAAAAGRTADVDTKVNQFLASVASDLERGFGQKLTLFEVSPQELRDINPTRAAKFDAAKAAAEAFGVSVRYFRSVNGEVADGFFNPNRPNEVWLNIRAKSPVMALTFHEFGHWLEKNHPDLWQDFADFLSNRMDLSGYHADLQAQYKAAGGNQQVSRLFAVREAVSDVFGDMVSDLLENKPTPVAMDESLFKRILKAIAELIDSLINRVLGKQTQQETVELPLGTQRYLRDLQDVREAVASVLEAIGERSAEEARAKAAVQRAMEEAGIPGQIDASFLKIVNAVAPPQGSVISLPEENKVERFLFDSFSRVLQMERELEQKAGRKLADEESIRLAEKLYHGRVWERAHTFEAEYIQPLTKALKGLKKFGLTVRDLDDYLMALHAPERNATLKARDPSGRDGLSGLTDDQAAEIINGFSKEEREALDAAKQHVRRIIDFRMKTLVDGGLITKDAAKYLETRWPNYVPLKTLDVERAQLGTGIGYEMWATDIQTAFGRTSSADTPVGFAIADALRAIVRAEKARVEQAIWRAAHIPELSEILRPYDPKDPPKQLLSKEIDAKTGQAKDVIDIGKVNNHVLNLVIDGKHEKVFIADETLASQLRRAGEFENVGRWLESIGWLTRGLGRLLTEYNPSWFFPNAIKDAISASIRASGIEGMSVARLLREIPISWAQIFMHKVGRKFGLDSEGAKLYDEFRQAGGTTGAYGMQGPDEIMRELAAAGAPTGYVYADRPVYKMMVEPLALVLRGISAANEMLEYATRFAAYKEARRAGYSIDRAAEIGKEITVNFNRHGEISRAFNSFYVFFNAALQGLYGTAKFMGAGGQDVIQRGKVNTKAVISGAAGLATVGALVQWLNEWLGGDDEETGEKRANQHSDFILDKNVSFVGVGKSGEGIVKIPLPPEYAAFYAIGRRLYRAGSQGEYAREAAGIASNIIDAVAPVRFADDTSAVLAGYKALTPSVLLPIGEVLTNSNFLGARIVPEPIGSGPPAPYYTYSRSTTSELAKSISETLNSVTGGTAVRPGLSQKVLGPLSSPEAIEHLARTYAGGLGQFVMQAKNVAQYAAGQKEEIEKGKLPIVSRFVSERPPSYVERRYREIADEIQYELKEARLGNEPKNQAARSAAAEYMAAERQLRPLYKEFRQAAAEGDERRKKEIRERVASIKANVLKAYNEAAKELR